MPPARRMGPKGLHRAGPTGRLSPNREAWVDTFAGTFGVDTLFGEGGEPGPVVLVTVSKGAKYYMSFNLVSLTEAELDATQALFELAFAKARPIVQERDRNAQEGYDNGDPTLYRNYREVPKLFVRPRKESSDSEGLWPRPDESTDLLRPVGTISYAGGVPCVDLLEPDPQQRGSFYNGPSSRIFASVWKVLQDRFAKRL